jgi:signal transduction histidine kinase
VRPLDRLASIKLKLGVVILAAVAVTVLVVTVGEQLGISPYLTGFTAAVLALAMVQFLAHGMTYPLREMASAARAMAHGDYARRVTATSRDEVGDLARAFNEMSRQLSEVDRLRRDLVANASHELRTPLGALRAQLENIIDGVEPGDSAAIEDALRQVERLTDLVDQLLDRSKLESGAVPLELSEIRADALLDQVVAEWSEPASSRGVRIELEPGSPELVLRVDVDRMRQVLANLVANAIRHSPEVGRVLLSARAEGSTTRLEVADEGPGIPADDLERVFERFYRSDPARSADVGGAGLGLAIAAGSSSFTAERSARPRRIRRAAESSSNYRGEIPRALSRRARRDRGSGSSPRHRHQRRGALPGGHRPDDCAADGRPAPLWHSRIGPCVIRGDSRCPLGSPGRSPCRLALRNGRGRRAEARGAAGAVRRTPEHSGVAT